MHDVALREVQIVDGTGADARPADVGITDGRIAEVGSVGSAKVDIDGQGHTLAPGFVDVHSHDDGALIEHPDMWFKANQGVTSVVIGNCGTSAVGSKVGDTTGGLLFGGTDWEDLAVYREAVARAAPSINATALVGHNTIREAVIGLEDRPASPAELDQMRGIVRRAMEQGACGFSAGLLFAPGKYAPQEELVELVSEIAPFGGTFSCHIRNEFEDLLPSVNEAMEVGRLAGVPTQISHHKAAGRANWGMIPESLRRVDEVVEGGQDVTLDVYPYTAGSGLIFKYFYEGIDLDLAEVMRIGNCPSYPEYDGRMLVDIAEDEGRSLEEVVKRILASPSAKQTVCLQFLADEADIEANLRHPRVMIGSDGIPQLNGSPHPRLVGTFPRVLGEYVRERQVAPLVEMVRRMTSLPADRFGLTGRGRIVPDNHADLVLFDPDRIKDEATYDDPLQPCLGIDLVMVEGEVIRRDGSMTGARPGSLLDRRRG